MSFKSSETGCRLLANAALLVLTPFCSGSGAEVLNVHLRPQIGDSGPNVGGVMSGMITTPPIRRDEIDAYLSVLEPGIATIIAGDFNESETGGVVSRLRGDGYRSALPEFSAEDTWRWNSRLGTISRRFDHIVYGAELVALSARVLQAGRSDHLPVVAVLGRKVAGHRR